jgi:hypothetical protein
MFSGYWSQSRSFWLEPVPIPEPEPLKFPEPEPNPEPHDQAGAAFGAGAAHVGIGSKTNNYFLKQNFESLKYQEYMGYTGGHESRLQSAWIEKNYFLNFTFNYQKSIISEEVLSELTARCCCNFLRGRTSLSGTNLWQEAQYEKMGWRVA